MSSLLKTFRRKFGVVEADFPSDVTNLDCDRDALRELEGHANDLLSRMAMLMSFISCAVAAFSFLTALAANMQFTLAAIVSACLVVIVIACFALVYFGVYRWIAKRNSHYQDELISRSRNSNSYI